MSRSINRVELLGHLGKDAEVKFTPSGIQIANFSIATSRSYKPQNSTEWKEVTDWHKCILWRCEKLAGFLTKGKQVLVIGRQQTRSWDDHGTTRYMTEVVCEELILLGGGDGSGRSDRSSSRNSGGSAGSADAPPPGPDDFGVTDDDVPF